MSNHFSLFPRDAFASAAGRIANGMDQAVRGATKTARRIVNGDAPKVDALSELAAASGHAITVNACGDFGVAVWAKQ